MKSKSQRRVFLKKAAVFAGAAVATTSLVAEHKASGSQTITKAHKDVLYKKTPAWELYYKNAK